MSEYEPLDELPTSRTNGKFDAFWAAVDTHTGKWFAYPGVTSGSYTGVRYREGKYPGRKYESVRRNKIAYVRRVA